MKDVDSRTVTTSGRPAATALLAAVQALPAPPACTEHPDALFQQRADYRALMAGWTCTGCPVLTLCGAAADEAGEHWGVWGGVDRTRRAGAR